MVIVLLAVLGVDLIMIVAFFGVVLSRRRWVSRQPGAFKVWTNLINNAVDAMCDSGTLRVTTRVENGEVVIEIGDTGPGIPP
jgi:signal transduction histidine kinase